MNRLVVIGLVGNHIGIESLTATTIECKRVGQEAEMLNPRLIERPLADDQLWVTLYHNVL